MPISIAPQWRRPPAFYFTAYDTLGWFGEDAVTIEVTGVNKPPEFTSFVANPWQIGPSPTGAVGTSISTGNLPEGVSRITVTATDPDGDPLSYYWYPTDMGSFFDSATGQILDNDLRNGLVLTDTGEPYSAPSILYVAPDAGFIVGDGIQPNFPLGIWVGLWAIVTDGDMSRMTWGMVDVVPVKSEDCIAAKTHLCENIQKQSCNTSTMGKAVGKVSDACGSGVASAFSSNASAYCRSSGDSFSVSECAAQ